MQYVTSPAHACSVCDTVAGHRVLMRGHAPVIVCCIQCIEKAANEFSRAAQAELKAAEMRLSQSMQQQPVDITQSSAFRRYLPPATQQGIREHLERNPRAVNREAVLAGILNVEQKRMEPKPKHVPTWWRPWSWGFGK